MELSTTIVANCPLFHNDEAGNEDGPTPSPVAAVRRLSLSAGGGELDSGGRVRDGDGTGIECEFLVWRDDPAHALLEDPL